MLDTRDIELLRGMLQETVKDSEESLLKRMDERLTETKDETKLNWYMDYELIKRDFEILKKAYTGKNTIVTLKDRIDILTKQWDFQYNNIVRERCTGRDTAVDSRL